MAFLLRHHHHHHGNSIAGGLVKGALSVAASAYKALFAGPPVTAQVSVCFIFLNQIQGTSENSGICLGWREAHIIIESMSFKFSLLLIGG